MTRDSRVPPESPPSSAPGSSVDARKALLGELDARDGALSKEGSALADDDQSRPLMPGRIGHYEVLREIGRGGMGVVYLAEDTSLGRRVALKIIASEVASDPRRIKRFEREARLLAALNHPNIATVYSFERSDELSFLTMELIEGTPLDVMLLDGPLSVDATVETMLQITKALEVAHASSVVHRDLKPGNVMVSSDGMVKVLDFGLAKSARPSNASVESITLANGILGTPGYASPEQLRSEPADARADMWSFGCVFYECLTGQRAFDGKSVVEIIEATLGRQPDWDLLPAGMPRFLRDLIEDCLAKDPILRPPDMTSVRRAIETGVPSPRPRIVSQETDARDVVPNNVPLPTSSFVGRDRQLADLRRLLGTTRLLTLAGPGGCGKTRLALESALRVLTDFPGGTWIVQFAPLNDPTALEQAVATAVGAAEKPGLSLTDSITAALSGKKSLLVLDNCEHVIDDAATLATELLQRSPEVRVLATSREPLRVAGESIYRLGPLEVPAENSALELDELEGVEAVRLFTERATSANADFAFTAKRAPDVVKICKQLDGIPLALELAAARVAGLPVAQIAARLDDRFRLLTVGTRTSLPHHQTLRVLIDWSHQLLPEDERVIFRQLSVFAGGWSIESATAVCADDALDADDILNVVTSLAAKSLVELTTGAVGNDGETRYWMLETIRAYAAEQLVASGEHRRSALRHRDHFVDLAVRARSHMHDHTQGTWFDRLAVDQDNLVAAFQRCVDDGATDLAVRLIEGVRRFWKVRGHWTVGLNACARVLEHPSCGKGTPLRASILDCAGHLAWARGEADRARVFFEEALDIATQHDLEPIKVSALLLLGTVFQRQGENVKARSLLERSLVIARRIDDRIGVAGALNSLGLVSYSSGDYTLAGTHFDEGLAIWRDVNDTASAANTLNNLALVAMRQGDYGRALLLFDESLELARALGDESALAGTLNNLGMVAHHLSDSTRARVHFEEALEVRRRLDQPWGVAVALQNLAEVLLVTGDYDEAADLLGESLAIARELGDREGIANCLGCLGSIAAARGDHDKALSLQSEQLALFHETENRAGVIDVLESLASIYIALDEPPSATRLLGAATSLREDAGIPAPPSERAPLDQSRQAARRALGPARFDEEWDRGSSMTLDEAVTFAACFDKLHHDRGRTDQEES